MSCDSRGHPANYTRTGRRNDRAPGPHRAPPSPRRGAGPAPPAGLAPNGDPPRSCFAVGREPS
eukprot:13688035-Alexandrium_andersonii.AAC.1